MPGVLRGLAPVHETNTTFHYSTKQITAMNVRLQVLWLRQLFFPPYSSVKITCKSTSAGGVAEQKSREEQHQKNNERRSAESKIRGFRYYEGERAVIIFMVTLDGAEGRLCRRMFPVAEPRGQRNWRRQVKRGWEKRRGGGKGGAFLAGIYDGTRPVTWVSGTNEF